MVRSIDSVRMRDAGREIAVMCRKESTKPPDQPWKFVLPQSPDVQTYLELL